MIPGILRFRALLGLDENEFPRETRGTIKPWIEFIDWTFIGDRYVHAFGRFRQDMQLTTFEQVWQKMNMCGRTGDLKEYSITQDRGSCGQVYASTSRGARFFPGRSNPPVSTSLELLPEHVDSRVAAR
jgi:hypothetical protein